MDEQPTCGKGLAEHARLPSMFAEVLAAMTGILEHHMKALDAEDAASREERAAYASLARTFGRLAFELRGAADEMTGYRELPMGKHDEAVMGDHAALEALERYVTLEHGLSALLHLRLEQDQKLLAAWRAR
jgi:hypothetical protein